MTTPLRVVTFRVVGIAQPKGSSRAFVPKSWAKQAVAAGRAPRAVVTSDNPKGKGWEQLVREQAQAAASGELMLGPVRLSVEFQLPRPKSLPKRVQHCIKKPDLSKLARSLEDGLTGVLFADDAQVVHLDVRKRYAAIGSAPCAVVRLDELADSEAIGLFGQEAFYDTAGS